MNIYRGLEHLKNKSEIILHKFSLIKHVDTLCLQIHKTNIRENYFMKNNRKKN